VYERTRGRFDASSRGIRSNVAEEGSRFVALAAHELRAPAAVIHGVATTLEERGDQFDAERLHALHHLLRVHTTRLIELADQLLDLSRLDDAAVHLERRPVAVRRHVEQVVAEVAGDRVDELEIDVDDGLEVLADPDALDRIVGNLVTNALRYGGAPVRIAAEYDDQCLSVIVEDAGPGVTPEFERHLFERFSREGGAPRRGAGLGLAIAQQYALEHGGHIAYERRRPHGARFRVVVRAAGNGS
jgi:signal transduction histidine kinase